MNNSPDTIRLVLKCSITPLEDYCKGKETVPLQAGDIFVCYHPKKDEFSYWVFSQVDAGVYKFMGWEGNRLNDKLLPYKIANCETSSSSLLDYFFNVFGGAERWYVVNSPKDIFKKYWGLGV